MPTGSRPSEEWDTALKRNDGTPVNRGPGAAGIRRRMMMYLAAFVAFVLALLWLFQIVFLNDFYRWNKTGQIR